MSQRTRRPYLREDVRFGCDVEAITEGTTCEEVKGSISLRVRLTLDT